MRCIPRVTSAYSFNFGTSMPSRIVTAARAAGISSLLLADRNSLAGAPAFEEACRTEGIQPLFGAQIAGGFSSAIRNRSTSPALQPRHQGNIIFVAKNRKGFSELCRILSSADHPLPTAEHLIKMFSCGKPDFNPEGLVALSDSVQFLAAARYCMDCRTLVDPCNLPSRSSLAELTRLGCHLAASPDITFIDDQEREVQRILVAIASGCSVFEVPDSDLSPITARLRPVAEFDRMTESIPGCSDDTRDFKSLISFESLFSGWVFPPHASGNDADRFLRNEVLAGALLRYGSRLDSVRARIDHELAIIAQKGFSSYFLVVRDIVRMASRSCGRGSAAASIISYSLGITDVDPVAHDLYFDRFLNPGRSDPPDIDIDFAWDERDALLEKVVSRYGSVSTARVANHITYQPRSALRETARAFGLPEGEIGEFEKKAEGSHSAVSAPFISAVAGAMRQISTSLQAADSVWNAVAVFASRLINLPRHAGVHSGGIVIVPDAIDAHVPVIRTGTGIRVTAWDKDGIEAAGLVKIDLLGNRSLAVVRDCLINLEERGIIPGYPPSGQDMHPGNHPSACSPEWNPLTDPPTIEMLSRGDSMGVFYVESPAMRMLQRKTGYGDYAHLVIHSSIIRPAANRFIDEYIDRLKGKPYRPLHPLIGDLLSESFGIMCYQEDVCKVAVALAGFSSSEADGMRKILAKKDVHTRIQSWKDKFISGALKHGVEQSVIESVWTMIESFSGYSFVKAHSASYAMLSFKSAWLRVHYPAEFMAAVISNRGGYYSTLAYVSECRRMGLSLLSPDINLSTVRCRGRDSRIRIGLGMIKGLSDTTATAIVSERQHGGHYLDLDDFFRRTDPERDELEALTGAGAFDRITPGTSRATILMYLLSRYAERESSTEQEPEFAFSENRIHVPLNRLHAGIPVNPGSDSSIKSAPLLLHDTVMLNMPMYSAASASDSTHSNRQPDSRKSILENQLQYLGTTLDAHPLTLWPKVFARPRVLAKDIPFCAGKQIELVGWPITAKHVLTSTDEIMQFVSFEDETALFDTVLFPDVHGKYRHLLWLDVPLLLCGRVDCTRGAYSLEVTSLVRLDR